MKFDLNQSLAALRSKLTKTRLLGLGAVALAALALSSCRASGFAVEGVVVDSDSGKPVPNAWVHQEWKVSDRIPMSWSSSSATGCVAEQVSKADANGKFRFEVPTTLHYNAITQSAVAVMSPLILGYSLDEARVEERGTKSSLIMTSRVIVAVKKYAPTRQALADHGLGLMGGWSRCGPAPAPASAPVGVFVTPGAKSSNTGNQPVDEKEVSPPDLLPPDNVRIIEVARFLATNGITIDDLRAAIARRSEHTYRDPNPNFQAWSMRQQLARSPALATYRQFLNTQSTKP